MEKMEIDDLVALEREIAEKNRGLADNLEKGNNKRLCIEQAEKHETIAELLEELKVFRENKWTQLYTNRGYHKGVDDFERELIAHLSDWEASVAPVNDDETDRFSETICETIENAIGAVEETAERLKEGFKKNEMQGL